MLNNKMIKKINKHNHTYTKKAFIRNLKEIVKYSIYDNCSYFDYLLWIERYKFWARKFHINLNKYETQIRKRINK